METKPAFAIVFENGRYQKLVIEKIIRLQSDNGYTDIFAEKGKCVTSCNSLTHCEKQLEGNSFCRIHQSHLVNLNEVEKIKCGKNCVVIMSDKSEAPVSRKKKKDFLANFIVL